MMMKNLILLLILAVVFQSCITVPGQYLTKHDPGYFRNKNDGIVHGAFEQSGLKSGVKIGANYAFSDHLFAGLNAGIYKNISLQEHFKMQGISIRPEIGYYINYGNNDAIYLEFHTGGGFQYNSYSINTYRSSSIIYDKSRPLQIFGGAFMGFRKEGKKFGFDINYEHNFFKDPIIKRPFGFMDPSIEDPTEYISRSYNITSSVYVSRSIRDLDIFFNPGFNIGYTAVFLRFGVMWRI